MLNALFHRSQVLRVDHAAEGVPREKPEFLHGAAAKDPQKAPVGKNDLFIASGLVDQKSAGHLLHKADHFPGSLLLFKRGALRPEDRSGRTGAE